VSEVCDLGYYKDCIVPPNCVRLKLVGIKGRRHLVVDSVRAPNIPGWKPLIVIANRKSGNGDGEHILQAFRALLNPAQVLLFSFSLFNVIQLFLQVIDLSEISPECGLEWCHLLPSVTCRILVAGGDGTVGWVLQAIDNLRLKVYFVSR
jgi:diacylglycerol kinase (ATP)